MSTNGLIHKIKSLEELFNQGSRLEAIKNTLSLLKKAPNHEDLLNTLAIFYAKNKQLEESSLIFKKLIKLSSNEPKFKYNLANLLVLQYKFFECKPILESLAEEYTNNFKYQREAGILCTKIGDLDLAKKYLSRAINLDKNNFDLIFTMSTVLLKKGEFAEGWRLYESRFKHSVIGKKFQVASKRIFEGKIKRYSGEDLSNKTLLIHDEQGFGDFLLVMRYLEKLKRKYKSVNIIVVCKEPLREILQRTDYISKVYTYSDQRKIDATHFDFWDFIMSIPKYFENDSTDFDNFLPYINYESKLKPHYHDLFEENKLNIGISYHGNSGFINDEHRSMRSLEPLKELINQDRYNFIYLNIDDISDQVKKLGLKIKQPRELESFHDTYTILKKLDLVISTDTAIVHLAGSTGVPCWSLLGCISTSWIWGDKKDKTMRYPSVSLYRQKKPNDWAYVVNKVKTDLDKFSSALLSS